jgi:hypothetical protein
MALMRSVVAWSSGASVAAAGEALVVAAGDALVVAAGDALVAAAGEAAAVVGVEYTDLFAQGVVVLSVGVAGKVCEALEYACVALDPPPGFVLPLLLILFLRPSG